MTMSILVAALRFLLFVVAPMVMVSGFSFVAPSSLSSPSQFPSRPFSRSLRHASASALSSSADTVTDTTDTLLFPVLRRISGIEWTGTCRYVGADLALVKELTLFGGIRYDVSDGDGDALCTCTLSSFLTFPNGKTREVVMTGTIPSRNTSHKSAGTTTTTQLRLHAAEDKNSPIYMVLTELAPDTILINEVDSASGAIVLTASLSLVTGTGNGAGAVGRHDELIQVSHEVGDNNNNKKNIIEGHQVWRLKPTINTSTAATQSNDDDSDYNVRIGTTGR
jgi:hypothetical protein